MKKLVVIDDEQDFCKLVEMYCNKNGIECRFANTLSHGIELVGAFLPDVVILDNNLPDGHGWTQAQYLLDTYPNMSLNLITAKKAIDKTNSEHASQHERISFFYKPLSMLQLGNIVDNA
jgi:DNA-binding NtrC family response regulator